MTAVVAALAAGTLALGDWDPSALESSLRAVRESPNPPQELVLQASSTANTQAPIVARRLRTHQQLKPSFLKLFV